MFTLYPMLEVESIGQRGSPVAAKTLMPEKYVVSICKTERDRAMVTANVNGKS